MEMDMIFVPLGVMPGLLQCNKKRGLITPGRGNDPRYFRRAPRRGMRGRLNAGGGWDFDVFAGSSGGGRMAR
jgi:hypothetical protein